MARAEVPQVITVDVAEVAIDSTGAPQYDGETRLSWPFGVPAPYTSARVEFGLNLDQTDINVDLVFRDFDASSNVADVDSLTADTDFESQPFDPSDIPPGNNVGLRVNVDTASATAGAEAHVTIRLVLIP